MDNQLNRAKKHGNGPNVLLGNGFCGKTDRNLSSSLQKPWSHDFRGIHSVTIGTVPEGFGSSEPRFRLTGCSVKSVGVHMCTHRAGVTRGSPLFFGEGGFDSRNSSPLHRGSMKRLQAFLLNGSSTDTGSSFHNARSNASTAQRPTFR